MSLKVFDLQCDNGHVFEGWFTARNSFETQASQRLLSCPVCGNDVIERKLSAPRLNLGKKGGDGKASDFSMRSDAEHTAENVSPTSPQLAEFQGKLLQHVRTLIKNSEDVGDGFAHEALKIHNGEAEERAIRGTATDEERRELREEGIAVMAVPDVLNDDQLQ